MLREELIQFLKEQTGLLDIDAVPDCLTAGGLEEMFQRKRTTISQYLNDFVEENICFKIASRPVYFLHKEAFEKRFFPVTKKAYNSVEELKADGAGQKEMEVQEKETIFSRIIGYNGSMRKAISAIKTSVFYPDNSLPILITGETGTGKSFLAECTYQYAVEKKILEKNAPYVTFNCALYADNPELLSSYFFGHVKGAFTGAVANTKGVLEAADGGILFLDEVHRLNAESQEKLFVFLDKGIFYRVGDENCRRANVRIIAATTESLTENFLGTFLRRFPIHVSMPSLEERGKEEKLQLIYSFLLREAERFQKEIRVSGKALNVLAGCEYKGNVGELKSAIKFMCSSINVKMMEQKKLEISMLDLPESVLKSIPDSSRLKMQNHREVIVSPDEGICRVRKNNGRNQEKYQFSLSVLWEKYQRYKKNHKQKAEFERECSEEVCSFLEKILDEQKSGNGILFQLLTKSAEEISGYLHSHCKLWIRENNILAIVSYLCYREISQEEKSLAAPLLEYVRAKKGGYHKTARDILQLVEERMDIVSTQADEIILSFYLMARGYRNNKANALILAHGYATASSISDTVNQILGNKVFESFDMPMDMKVEEIVGELLAYLRLEDDGKGLIILVDMGSLREIYCHIREYINEPVLLVNNVTTQLAVEIGELILNDCRFDGIADFLKGRISMEYSLFYPEMKRKKGILTCCATGIGTAIQLQRLLKSSMPEEMDVEVIPCAYTELKEKGRESHAFNEVDVIGIAGTSNPHVEGVDYVDLQDLISGKTKDKMRKMLDSVVSEELIELFDDNLIRNFGIERLIGELTILDPRKIIDEIRIGLEKYQYTVGKKLENGRKLLIYFHVACMVERLIRGVPIGTGDVPEENEAERKLIKESFCRIEEKYNIEIPQMELQYINKIIKEMD